MPSRNFTERVTQDALPPAPAIRRKALAVPATGGRYALGTSGREQRRLQQQSGDLRAWSAALLDRIGIRPGSRVIEIGCGPSGVLDLLSERAGASGQVVGMDLLPEHVALARAFCRRHELANVAIVEGDAARTGLPAESFDLAYARLVLVNIPDPEAVVAEMARLVRPGGSVALDEASFATFLCDPPHHAWDRLLAAFQQVYTQDGADPEVVRRLPGLLRRAGLTGIGVQAHAAVIPPGHPRRMILLDLLSNIRGRILDRGVLTAAELEQLTASLGRHLGDPDTVVVSHLHLQAWGRKT